LLTVFSSAIAAVLLDADFSPETARGDNAKKGPRTIQPAYFLKFSIDEGAYWPTSIMYPGIAHVTTLFPAVVVERLSKEHRSLGAPFVVTRLDVSDAQVEKTA
jgi:hypothetical protein